MGLIMTEAQKRCRHDEYETYVWESSDGAYEDYRYTCQACGYRWWVDGPDA